MSELQKFTLVEVRWANAVVSDVLGAAPIGFLARDDAEARRVLALLGHASGKSFRLLPADRGG
jgi:hypothetical protein